MADSSAQHEYHRLFRIDMRESKFQEMGKIDLRGVEALADKFLVKSKRNTGVFYLERDPDRPCFRISWPGHMSM
jgi:hypothetical protein